MHFHLKKLWKKLKKKRLLPEPIVVVGPDLWVGMGLCLEETDVMSSRACLTRVITNVNELHNPSYNVTKCQNHMHNPIGKWLSRAAFGSWFYSVLLLQFHMNMIVSVYDGNQGVISKIQTN